MKSKPYSIVHRRYAAIMQMPRMGYHSLQVLRVYDDGCSFRVMISLSLFFCHRVCLRMIEYLIDIIAIC